MENIEILKKYKVDVNAALDLWGDIPSFNDALKDYINSLQTKSKELEQLIEISDWNNYSILAHSLKSESKYLGFIEAAEVFLLHEQKGKEADGNYIKENFKNLRDTIKQILNIIEEYFGEKKKLLIADDSDIILNFLEKNIGEEYDVLKANDGRVALEQIKNNNIYAILLDLNMPNQNGFEVLEYLKEKELMNEIPVVIITGDDSCETIEKALSYPVLNVLKKPFHDLNIKNSLDKIKDFYEQKK